MNLTKRKDKCCSFKLLSKDPEKYVMVLTEILSSTTVFNINNKKKYLFFFLQISMISEGSCDIEVIAFKNIK